MCLLISQLKPRCSTLLSSMESLDILRACMKGSREHFCHYGLTQNTTMSNALSTNTCNFNLTYMCVVLQVHRKQSICSRSRLRGINPPDSIGRFPRAFKGRGWKGMYKSFQVCSMMIIMLCLMQPLNAGHSFCIICLCYVGFYLTNIWHMHSCCQKL